MIDENRIKEAEANFRTYLNDELVKKCHFENLIFQTYLRNYKESILLAENILKNRSSDLWVIVVSYYSMFYIANAVLYKLGYKIGHKIAHKITYDALIIMLGIN